MVRHLEINALYLLCRGGHQNDENFRCIPVTVNNRSICEKGYDTHSSVDAWWVQV